MLHAGRFVKNFVSFVVKFSFLTTEVTEEKHRGARRFLNSKYQISKQHLFSVKLYDTSVSTVVIFLPQVTQGEKHNEHNL